LADAAAAPWSSSRPSKREQMMDAIEPWIRDALTAEVEETVRELLWNDVLRQVWC